MESRSEENHNHRAYPDLTSGVQNYPHTGIEIYPSPDFVKLALAAELSERPGEVYRYNNKSLNLVAGIFQHVTGKRMDSYIGERLFKPLGILDYRWSLDPSGNPHMMSGCQIKPHDFVKLGMLVANEGKFDGSQIIDKAISTGCRAISVCRSLMQRSCRDDHQNN